MPVQPNIPLGEEFTSLVWTNYTSFDEVTRDQLPFQQHLDIRPFTETPVHAGGGDFLAPEDWELPAESSTGPQAAINHFPALALTTANGVVEATSVVKDHSLNLTESFALTDLLVFTVPSAPAGLLEATSYIELIDREGNTTSLAFSRSEVPVGEAGYFKLPLKYVAEGEADLTKIVGVRFRIAATEVAKLYVAGLRVIKATLSEAQPGWKQSPSDFDNWNGRFHKTIPLGSLERAPDYQQSIIWKSAPLAGPLDPRPVNAEFGVVFNVGSLTNANEFTMYFRQESKIFTTMLDLIGVSMGELDGRPMPDLGTRQFNPRTVGEFDETEMEELDRFDMEELERQAVPNPVLESWVYFTFAWDKHNPSISMGNSSGLSYNFSGLGGLSLKEGHNYFVVFALEESTARARLYDLQQVLEDGGLEEVGAGIYQPTGDYFAVNQTPLFDTTVVDDDNVFRRRKGRIGWSTSFQDADVFIRSMRPRGVTFAEYESAPLMSHTPVAGASLFANVLPGDTSLWNGELALFPEGTTRSFLELDKSRTTSKGGFSYRVTNKGVAKQGDFQGLHTEYMNFTDLEQMQIEFNLWFAGPAREREKIEKVYRGFYPGNKSFPGPARYPGAKVTVTTEPTVASIIAQLVSTDGTVIPLTMPELETNQWQHITLRVPLTEVIQTGFYQLRILQQTRLATNWWVDGLKVLQRSVAWSARSVTQDPWGGTYAPWIDFMDVVNDRLHNSGISLEPRGKELQMRGRARRQDVMIQKPQIVPRYAELGRLVWPEEVYKGTAPTAEFKVEHEGEEVLKFTDESTNGSGAIVNREWTFGDGERIITNAHVVEHTYTKPGTYSVTLQVVDRHGKLNSKIKEVEAT